MYNIIQIYNLPQKKKSIETHFVNCNDKKNGIL
jgi:hypothetical protein